MVKINQINTSEDLERAFTIREQVFVIEQNVAPEIEYDEFESGSIHYLALVDDKAAGTARWRRTENGIKLERFAVLEEYRGQKVGAALLSRALQDVIPLNPKKIYLHAQVQVIPFYEKFGFAAEGDEFIEADIRHRVMVYRPA